MFIHIFKRLVPGALLFLATAQSVLADKASFDQGAYQYGQRKYDLAAQSFAAGIKNGSGTAKDYYYLANCLYGLRRLDDAIKVYWYLAFTYPSTSEAYSARSFLKQIDRNYNRDVNDPALKNQPGIKELTQDEDKSANVATTAKPMSQSQKQQIIEALVLTVRGNAGRPDVTPKLVSNVKEALLRYPTNLLGLIYAKGCKIYLTPTMIDKEPGLQNTKPSGYEDGSTFKNCPGMFQNGNEIVVCELALSNRDDEWMTMEDPLGTLRHELGHAVDHYLGQVSGTEEFKHLYRLESAKVDESVKPTIEYFLQKDYRGPSETFAEIMCYEYGGRTAAGGKDKTTDAVHSSFPQLSSMIRQKIAEIPSL